MSCTANLQLDSIAKQYGSYLTHNYEYNDGATAYGLGSQILDDAKKHGILLLNYMEHLWGVLMGRLIHETCKAEMKRPMRLLSLFEKAGEDAEARGEFLKWSVPITGFPVIQNYTEGTVKKTWVNC